MSPSSSVVDMRSMMTIGLVVSGSVMLCGGCHPSLSQEYVSLLPGSPEDGRRQFGVEWSETSELLTLETTGMSLTVVKEASQERFHEYLNQGYVPVGASTSRSSGEGPASAVRLAHQHGAALVVLEIDDPPPTTKTVQGSRPTLYTESVRISGTKNFEGTASTIGWEPAMVNIWVDPYQAKCRFWAHRSWPPVLGVYFVNEMSCFEGWPSISVSHPIKHARDRWLLQHPDESAPPMGAVVRQVLKDTTAQAIGLQAGDVLLSIQGQAIESETQARDLLNANAGHAPTVVVMRYAQNCASMNSLGWTIEQPSNPVYQHDPPLEWSQLRRSVQLNDFHPVLEQQP